MGDDRTTRRQVVAALAAAGVWPSVASGQMASVDLLHDSPSPLHGRGTEPYTPPNQLSVGADLYRRMTVPIRGDGAGPVGFVVHNRANPSVISRELARQL